jgi:hypothetical protein
LRHSPRLPGGDLQISHLTVEAMKIPLPGIKIESEVISLVNKRTSDAHNDEKKQIDEKIDRYVYELYNLNGEEREFIETTILYTD